jgi:hypothetical protein
MAVQTLITGFEVVAFSPAGRDYPTDKICPLIPQIEMEFGYECLGETLYDWMRANVTTTPTGTGEWQSGCSYDTGDYVTRQGWPFVSLADLNSCDPTNDDDPATWEEVERFGTNACANEFWEDYLRPILANKIFSRSLNFTTRKAGANGLTMLEGGGSYQSQGFRSGNKGELSDYKKDLNAELDTMVSNMTRWANLKIKNDSTCTVPLSSMPGCNPGLCAQSSNSARRWGFKY